VIYPNTLLAPPDKFILAYRAGDFYFSFPSWYADRFFTGRAFVKPVCFSLRKTVFFAGKPSCQLISLSHKRRVFIGPGICIPAEDPEIIDNNDYHCKRRCLRQEKDTCY